MFKSIIMKIRLYLTSILFLISVFAISQEVKQDTLTNKNLEEVVITASRVSVPLKLNPGSTSLVTPKELSTMPRTISVDEALRFVPGVRIDNQANGSRVHMSIRGQGILSERGLRGIRVIIDGIPVNDPSGFAPDLYDVDWATVNNIEVLRGPSAALYGGSSNAGVLNISTQDGGTKPVNGTAFVSAGSNGFYKILGQVDGTKDNLNYRVSYSRMGGNGYRHHTAFWANNFSEKVNWTPAKRVKITQTLLVTDYFNQNAEGLNLSQLNDPRQANPDAIPMNEYQKTRRVTNGISGEIGISEKQRIHFSGYIRLTDYKEPGSSAVQYRALRNTGGSLMYSLDLGKQKIKNHLSLGTDLEWQIINEHKVPNIKDSTRTEDFGDVSEKIIEGDILLANQNILQRSFGIFLIDRLELGPKLNAMLNVRYDDIHNELNDMLGQSVDLSGKADFDQTTARIGLVYTLSPSVFLFANWGQGFLPPATEELDNNPDSYGGFNSNLVPATSSGPELGMRAYLGNYLYGNLTAFLLNTKNDFYRYRITNRPLETFYGNAGSSRRYGLEAYLKADPVKNLELQLAYTYSHFTYTSPDSIDGNWLPNSPQHQLYADLSYKFLEHFSVGLSTELQSKWYIYTDVQHKDIYQDGFNLYHARISYAFNLGKSKAEIAVYAKNLTDKAYIAFTEPDPDGNSYQPGAGREFFGSLKIRF